MKEKGLNTLESAVACFLIQAQLVGLAVSQADIIEVSQSLKEDQGELFFLQMAKRYRLKVKSYQIRQKKSYEKLALLTPLIAQTIHGDYFMIAKLEDKEAVVLYPGEKAPQKLTLQALEEIWQGQVVLLGQKGSFSQQTGSFSFRWFFPTILRYKKELLYTALGIVVIQLLGIMIPIMTQVVIDKVLTHRNSSTLTVLVIGMALVFVFDFLMTLAKNYLFTHTTNKMDALLNFQLFSHLFRLPINYFESRRTGETVARVQELSNIRQFLTGTPLSSMIDLVFVSMYVAVLFYYNSFLTWIVLGSIPLYALLSALVTPLFRHRLDQKFKTGSEVSSYLVESIQGVQTIKSYSLEDKIQEKWGKLQADYVASSYQLNLLSSSSSGIAQFIQRIFDLLILYFGAKLVLDRQFSIGQLVAFRMLSSRISGPVLRLVQLWQEYQQANLSVEKIGDIFNRPVEVEEDRGHKLSLPDVKGNIQFDKVHFRYRMDASEAVKDLSFTIEAGTVVGIVGRSGSGKSTVAKLIQRLYIPERGTVRVDGMDISLVNPNQLRKQIGVVLQDNFMFTATVRENIALAEPYAKIEDIIAAAKTAGAHDFILQLPNGYDTIIGEKGLGLSGGQKQRIAIARAILPNPPLLIFDEATSALDYESETIIQENLKEICQGRTVLIIAHRLSTLRDAHEIMVLDQGSLLERGTHETLVMSNGLYASFYQQQNRAVTS